MYPLMIPLRRAAKVNLTSCVYISHSRERGRRRDDEGDWLREVGQARGPRVALNRNEERSRRSLWCVDYFYLRCSTNRLLREVPRELQNFLLSKKNTEISSAAFFSNQGSLLLKRAHLRNCKNLHRRSYKSCSNVSLFSFRAKTSRMSRPLKMSKLSRGRLYFLDAGLA